MSEENEHHDGLAQQRQALEQMSNDLTLRLQAMIAQQEQRAHEFNAIVPNSTPELNVPAEPEPQPAWDVVYEEPSSPPPPPAPTTAPAAQLPPTPQPAPVFQQPIPQAAPIQRKRPSKPRGLKPPKDDKEEGSIGSVAIGIIIFIIFIILRGCS